MRKLDITKVQKEFLVVLRNSFTQQGNVIYVIYVTTKPQILGILVCCVLREMKTALIII